MKVSPALVFMGTAFALVGCRSAPAPSHPLPVAPVPPKSEATPEPAPVIENFDLRVSDLFEAVDGYRANPSNLTIDAGSKSVLRYRFVTAAGTRSVAVAGFRQESLGRIGRGFAASPERIELIDSKGRVVSDDLDFGEFVAVDPGAEYVLEVSRSAPKESIALDTRLAVVEDSALPDLNERAMVARRCLVNGKPRFFANANIVSLMGAIRASPEGKGDVFGRVARSDLCGPALPVPPSGETKAEPISGLSGLERWARVSGHEGDLAFELAFDADANDETGTLKCSSGDGRTREVRDCVDFAIKADLVTTGASE